MAETRTFTARWVFPVAGVPLERGTVTITGDTITAVDPHGVRTADKDLGSVAIIPGLVNAHTHLDLSGARGLIPPTDPDHFTDWLRGVIAYRRTRTPEQVGNDIHLGLDECLRAGTTLIGDITSGGASWDAVSHAKTRAMLFWEIIGLSEEKFQAELENIAEKIGGGWYEDAPEGIYPQTQLCWWATSPHALYSANHSQALQQLWYGNSAIHFAESAAETELLTHQTGPFAEFLRDLGLWNPSDFTAQWINFATHVFIPKDKPDYRPPRLFIHCNYLPPDFPFKPQHTVVYCPRTHAAFGHPPHPFREFLARGVRVCLGTDSLASNPDLDILAEARFVHDRYPDFPGETLLRMITLSGAEALGWADTVGSLEPGKSADLVAVPLPDRDASDPYELLFAADAPAAPRRTLFRGEWRA